MEASTEATVEGLEIPFDRLRDSQPDLCFMFLFLFLLFKPHNSHDRRLLDVRVTTMWLAWLHGNSIFQIIGALRNANENKSHLPDESKTNQMWNEDLGVAG